MLRGLLVPGRCAVNATTMAWSGLHPQQRLKLNQRPTSHGFRF
jgi:hypothetical protein